MTQKTKLEIIGPYTPGHPGPFCTRAGNPVRIICTNRKGLYPIIALFQYEGEEFPVIARHDGVTISLDRNFDLMNAREVPVAREFWVNEYKEMSGDGFWFNVFSDKSTAKRSKTDTYIRTIHVREVLPESDQ